MSTRSAARTFRPWLICFALAFSLALSGCGKNTATVTGTVRYQGEPLPSGTILFYGSDGQPVVGGIEDGKYKVDDAPLGKVKIAIQVQDIAASPIGGGGRGGPGAPVGPGGPGAAGGAGGAPPGGMDMSSGPPGQDEHMKKPMPGSNRKIVQIPKEYQSPDTSGKEATLKKGKNTVNVDLD
jgi:hypothetical protein